MRRMKIEEIEAGMTLAMPISTVEGIMVLGVGSVLTESHLKRVREMQIAFVYIKDEEVPVEDEATRAVRVAKVAEIKKLAASVRVGKGAVNADKAKDMAVLIAEQWLKNPLVLKNIIDISEYNEHLLGHSVTVCVYSLLVGMHIGYDEMRLQDLGLGALLHDVGIMMVPSSIINKAGALTPAELSEMKKHPELGYGMLQQNSYLSLPSVHCAYQHHERYDGSGYPRGIVGDKIHPFAQIIAIADVYAALTITNNNLKRAIPPFSAISLLLRSRGVYFNPDFTNAFSASVMPYTLNTMVKLSNGYVAEIVDYRNADVTCPLMRGMYDDQKNRITKLLEMDIAKDPNFYIIDHWFGKSP